MRSFAVHKIIMEEKTLKGKKVAELKEIARTFGIEGYDAMRKAQLIEALMNTEEPGQEPEEAQSPAAQQEDAEIKPAEEETSKEEQAAKSESRHKRGAKSCSR